MTTIIPTVVALLQLVTSELLETTFLVYTNPTGKIGKTKGFPGFGQKEKCAKRRNVILGIIKSHYYAG